MARSVDETVQQLASELPSWLPVLRAACKAAASAEEAAMARSDGIAEFDAAYVRILMGDSTHVNLAPFVRRGLIEKSPLQSRRQYYVMPLRQEIELALRST